ncbi:restriction endonuclease subunit S [Bifidobacterium longum]|uniref:Restriction endonuclease subunit S n=1 Tax=Bifidobacterium longum TaxID=216816 RepID=A0AAW4NBH6_BIFLN|nr:restriction endonuclease subunit S [Bifidobacterium longum]
MTEQAKVPAIRFAGFTDPWEQRKLGEIVSIGAGAPPSAFSAGNFLYVKVDDLNESSHFQFDSAQRVDANTAVKPIRKGSIIFAKRGAAILGNKVRVLGKTAYIDTNMMALEPRGVDADFLWLFINQTGLYRIADTSTIPQINNKHIEPYPVDIPNMAEQQAIGTFFSRLDDLITLHQRKYDKLVVFKKSMLEKMFPKDGESVPEIRFAGFTDPWEQRKLGDVASSFDYGLNAAATEYDGQNKYLRITDIDDETHEFSKSDLTTPLADLAMSADYLLKESDLLFARTGASVGKTYLYRQFDGMVYFAGFLIRARIGEGADPEFAYQATLTDAYKKYVAITSQRSGQPGVNAQEYADYQLMLPSKTEQQQIGMTLRSLDDLITLHQRKLELLQNIKKSLLDKMFA